MGKNMDGKSSIRGGGGPTPNGKSHEKFHIFWNPSLNYDASSKKGFGDDYVKVAKSR